MRSGRQRTRGKKGLTLLEIMVVMAIIASITGAALYSIKSIGKASLRSTAFQLSAAIRYCYDRAITTNGYYRIVIDLDQNTYWAEHSNERMLLGRQKEKSPGKGQAFDQAAVEKERDAALAAEDEEMRRRGQGLGIALEPPPRAKRAKFESFQDAAIKQVKLKRVRLFDVYTPRQAEPYRKGRAYLYFFPDGHTERAMIHLSDGDDFFTLRVSPLTGQVTVHKGQDLLERDFDQKGESPR
ncbi:MAG: prepilin-type N-terminal cleavage/methylation domain-containing protein [Polyangia bacterium]